MIDSQNQKVGEGSFAVQAQGDVNIHRGMSPEQMGDIMVSLAGQLSKYFMEAESKAEKRFLEFKDKIIETFIDKNKANSEAFTDPDFQFLLRDAQNLYARTGDKDIGENLVNLLAQRSLIETRDRTSLILNHATETVGKLTSEELATLSVAFSMYSVAGGADNLDEFIEIIGITISPFLNKLPTTETSYLYLQSLGCITINQIGQRTIRDTYVKKYAMCLTDGFTQEEMEIAAQNKALFNSLMSENSQKISQMQSDLISEYENDERIDTASERFVLNFTSLEMAVKHLTAFGVDQETTNRIRNLLDEKLWSGSKFRKNVTKLAPETNVLFSNFESTLLSRVFPTSIGVSIGHSNLVRVSEKFRAPLGIWLQ